jgi:HEAT repeat protein
MDILPRLRQLRIVPVIVIDDPADAVPLASALGDGGLPCVEVTLRTPRALDALRRALKDTSPQVRMQAAAGLALKKEARNVTTVVKALEEETDAEVQLAILAALGRLATPEAVKRLVDAAEPGGLLFGKKTVAYRVAAAQALGEAKTPAARQALDRLVNDKEKEVRDAVFRILMQLKAEKAENEEKREARDET